MALLPIRMYPDPILRKRCAPVEVFDEDLEQLVENMVETMYAAPGIGLAAPQIGVEKRLALVDLSVGEDAEQLFVFANPEILESSGSDKDVEGCLSIPGFTDKVTRPTELRLRAQDLEGKTFEIVAEDWFARAICHELDHLNGVLFVDHLRGLRKERARRQLKKLVQEQEASP